MSTQSNSENGANIPVARLNHAVLYVRDLDRSVDFYHRAFGFEEIAREGGMMAFLRAAGSDNHHDLGLMAVGADAAQPGRRSVGLYHLAWEVPTINDLGSGRGGAHRAECDYGDERSRRDEVALRAGPGRHRVRGDVDGAARPVGRARAPRRHPPSRPQTRGRTLWRNCRASLIDLPSTVPLSCCGATMRLSTARDAGRRQPTLPAEAPPALPRSSRPPRGAKAAPVPRNGNL